MKLVISYYKDGTLRSVRSFEAFYEKGKSEREVLEQIEERNTQYGYERFKVEDVPDSQKELFSFLLGTGKYKAYAEMDAIGADISGVAGEVDEVGKALVGIRDTLDRIEMRYDIVGTEISKMKRW